MALPTDAQERKNAPIYSGVLKYFPDAIAAVAQLSKIGNDQHNPGQPLHWAREKSADHHDCLIRHAMDAGTIDTDGVRHSAKVAWRALAALLLELEAAQGVQDNPDDDGWIVADPNVQPPHGGVDLKWSDGDYSIDELVSSGKDYGAYFDFRWWNSRAKGLWEDGSKGNCKITHWRPSKESLCTAHKLK
jgi:hypothetical protein